MANTFVHASANLSSYAGASFNTTSDSAFYYSLVVGKNGAEPSGEIYTHGVKYFLPKQGQTSTLNATTTTALFVGKDYRVLPSTAFIDTLLERVTSGSGNIVSDLSFTAASGTSGTPKASFNVTSNALGSLTSSLGTRTAALTLVTSGSTITLADALYALQSLLNGSLATAVGNMKFIGGISSASSIKASDGIGATYRIDADSLSVTTPSGTVTAYKGDIVAITSTTNSSAVVQIIPSGDDGFGTVSANNASVNFSSTSDTLEFVGSGVSVGISDKTITIKHATSNPTAISLSAVTADLSKNSTLNTTSYEWNDYGHVSGATKNTVTLPMLGMKDATLSFGNSVEYGEYGKSGSTSKPTIKITNPNYTSTLSLSSNKLVVTEKSNDGNNTTSSTSVTFSGSNVSVSSASSTLTITLNTSMDSPYSLTVEQGTTSIETYNGASAPTIKFNADNFTLADNTLNIVWHEI